VFTLINTEDQEYLPVQATGLSAGFDLRARVDDEVLLMPGDRLLVPVGVALTSDFPTSYFLAICSRSGLAIDHGVYVLNAPGIVDADYIGHEIKVILTNCGYANIKITNKMRIAQALILEHKGSANLDAGIRLGGFGSTG
jgi:dUTP pyrophosphatase